MRIKQGSWSLERHPLWDAKEDEHCLTLTCSGAGGALQLSAARKSNGSVTPEDIDWCIRGYMDGLKGEWSRPASVTLGNCSGMHISATIDGTCGGWWVLGCGAVLLRTSYIGPLAYSITELAQAESMLSTLTAA